MRYDIDVAEKPFRKFHLIFWFDPETQEAGGRDGEYVMELINACRGKRVEIGFERWGLMPMRIGLQE
ncbi:MAG: hypothetical protein H7831_04640 [Magnetococcus sp. WYHC-3]